MQTINFDLGQLLKKIQAGHFLIPQFQRDFTWKEGQTKLLIDSIARNYPIGSLLILGKHKEVPLNSRKLDATYVPNSDEDINNDSMPPDEPSSESYYVLDGQQRLTSLARVFLDAHPKRNYYFDLQRMYKHFARENPSWIVSRVRGKKNPERKDNNRLIRTDIALDQQKSDVYISEYMEDSGDFPEFDKDAARQAAAKLKGVFETIRKFSIPFVALDNDAPLESVCRVFETINSTGTRLTTFDLAVARYYPDPDLKAFHDNSKDQHPILAEYEIDGERILQILSLYSLREAKKYPEATRSVLLSLPPEFIVDQWYHAAHCLSDVYQWVKKLGSTAKTKPPQGTLVSIAATLMCFPGSLSDTTFSTIIRRWYFCSTLAANPSPANNYKIGDDFRRFCDYLDNRDESIQYPSVHFTPSDIIDIKHTYDSRYNAIQALMRTTVREDLVTGNLLDDDLEDHHIYPKASNKSGINKSRLNSIANKVIVSRETNRRLGDENPDKYLIELVYNHKTQGNLADLDRRFRDCFIPYSSGDSDFGKKVRIESFDTFLEDRAKMIIKRITDVVGDAWKAPLEHDDDNLEDDESVTA